MAALAACGGAGDSAVVADGRVKPLAATSVDSTPAAMLSDALASASGTEPSSAAPNRAQPANLSKLYIVQMAKPPVTGSTGGVSGYKATKPGKGQKIDPTDPAVLRYGDYLAGRHDVRLQGVGGGRKADSYRYEFNGFAAELTQAQVAQLQADRDNKTCWGVGEGGGPNSDNVAAIDQAVADGVDVINFSISGTSTNFRDPVEIAFLFATDAGRFVAASAGNSGPTASTVAHPSPWITTVAASTHDRFDAGSVTLGNGAVYSGASLIGPVGPVGPAPLVLSSASGLAAGDAARLCFLNALDPAKVAGKIVVCDRGNNDRTEKSQEVKRAGGVGMVLVNTNLNSINADLHAVPTAHLAVAARDAVIAYAATAGAIASLSQGVASVGSVNAPLMATFSSRGPLIAGGGNLLKPDITAPCVDVLAAFSSAENGRDFDFLSGTSMSSPHMAGLAALMKQRHPTWSPMAIKSALMTTAYQTVRTGPAAGAAIPGGPFAYGAGHVDINKAVTPAWCSIPPSTTGSASCAARSCRCPSAPTPVCRCSTRAT